MNVEALRSRTGLTQARFAALLGVTQPAVAAWVAGRRVPTGTALARLHRIELATTGPTIAYPSHRGRSIELPAEIWKPVVEQAGKVTLPNRLDWSPRAGPRDLDDPVQRSGLYGQVLDEGTPFDIRLWIDPDLLVNAWPDVPIARHLREPVGDLVVRIQDSRG
ncbi:MAG: helix-turn-helix domain-containing protein [Acidimicrobiales bacterium]